MSQIEPSYSLLYVDDEPSLLHIAKIFIEKTREFSVQTVVSAKDALELLKTHRFDTIISDYEMPGMNGIELLKTVRSQGITIPFIIFTGRGREEIVIQAINNGADFYLQKGGDPKSQFAELISKVKHSIQRIRTEEKLHLTQYTIDTAVDPIFWVGSDLKFCYANSAACSYLGYCRDELLNMGIIDIDPNYTQSSLETFWTELKLSGSVRFESENKHKDRRLIPVELSAHYFQYAGKEFCFAIIRDISERKHAEMEIRAAYEQIAANEEELRKQYQDLANNEEELRESEERYRTVIENIQDVFYRTDTNGNLILASPSFIELLGYDSLEECYGKSIADDFYLDPSKRAEFLKAIEEKGFVSNYEVVLKHREGWGVLVSTNSHIYYKKDGTFAGVEGIFQDISAKKQAEEALKLSEATLNAIIQGSPIPEFVIDKNHKVIHWNHALAEYSGIKSEEMIGTNQHWKAFYPNVRPCMADLLVDTALETIPQWYKGKYQPSSLIKDAYEATDFFPHMGEKGIWLHFSAAMIKDQKGEIIGAVEILEDITERREAELNLERSYENMAVMIEELRVSDETLVEYVNNLEKTKTELVESEATLNAIIQYSPIPLFVINKNHQVIHWNKALAEYSGITEEEVIGSNQQWRAFYLNERPCMADLLVDGLIEKIPLWYKGKYSRSKFIEGAYEASDFFSHMGEGGTWLYFNAAPIRDINLEIIGAVEVLENITERKRAEEELLRMSQFQESIIINANVWLMVLDQRGTILMWNQAAETISGYKEAEVKGSNKIWKELYPDKEYRREITDTLIDIISQNRFLQNFETRILCKDGEEKIILWNTKVLGEEAASVQRFVAIGVDITKSVKAEEALAESEKILNAIIEDSPIPQFVINKNHQVTHWNLAMAKYSGINEEEIVGTNLQWRAFYPAERPCMADLLVDGAIEKIPEWYNGRYTKSNLIEGAYEAVDFFSGMGETGTWLSFTSATIKGVHGEIIGAVESFEDITEEKMSEESIKQANNKLNLLSDVTRHDILNTLTVLNGNNDIMLDLAEGTDLMPYIKRAERELDKVYQQILFTRDYQNLGVYAPTWQYLSEVISRADEVLSVEDLKIIEDTKGMEIYADSLLIKVMRNLIENSIMHGGDLSYIQISAVNRGDYALILYEDDGVGIPYEHKERIFDRGFGSHTGFGLFLVREILAITGIQIVETGVPGKGVCFEMTIPKGSFRKRG